MSSIPVISLPLDIDIFGEEDRLTVARVEREKARDGSANAGDV